MVWSCFPFIRSGQNHLASHSERGKKDKADRGRGGKATSGNGQAWSSSSPRGQWEQGKMEKTGCKIICGAPTTLAGKGLMMMMMTIWHSSLINKLNRNTKVQHGKSHNSPKRLHALIKRTENLQHQTGHCSGSILRKWALLSCDCTADKWAHIHGYWIHVVGMWTPAEWIELVWRCALFDTHVCNGKSSRCPTSSSFPAVVVWSC